MALNVSRMNIVPRPYAFDKIDFVGDAQKSYNAGAAQIRQPELDRQQDVRFGQQTEINQNTIDQQPVQNALAAQRLATSQQQFEQQRETIDREKRFRADLIRHEAGELTDEEMLAGYPVFFGEQQKFIDTLSDRNQKALMRNGSAILSMGVSGKFDEAASETRKLQTAFTNSGESGLAKQVETIGDMLESGDPEQQEAALTSLRSLKVSLSDRQASSAMTYEERDALLQTKYDLMVKAAKLKGSDKTEELENRKSVLADTAKAIRMAQLEADLKLKPGVTHLVEMAKQKVLTQQEAARLADYWRQREKNEPTIVTLNAAAKEGIITTEKAERLANEWAQKLEKEAGTIAKAGEATTNVAVDRQEQLAQEKYDSEIKHSRRKNTNRMTSLRVGWNRVDDQIDKAIDRANFFTTGTGAKWLAEHGVTANVDLHEALRTIEANIGFDTLRDMKDNSPSGSALGQVSNIENRLLASVRGSLEPNQSAAVIKENLRNIKADLQLLRELKEQDFEDVYNPLSQVRNKGDLKKVKSGEEYWGFTRSGKRIRKTKP